MKIALCFSGQVRSFRQGYEYYKRNLLNAYDVDVYIHSWNSPFNQEIIDLYKPKAYKFDDPLNVDCSRYTRTPIPLKHPQIATYSMYYSLNESGKLVNGTYDWVIKSRTDYALNVKIDFATFNNSKLYVPDCYIAPNKDRANDQFAFSSQDNMKKYMSTFDSIDEYYDNGAIFNGEDLMQANIIKQKLSGDTLVYVPMNNPFPPGPWNGTWHSLIRDDITQWK
jgi:hypothetical protein